MSAPFATACTECDQCRLHVARLDAAMAGIMDMLHAERESHAAQVSAMLEERALLQGQIVGLLERIESIEAEAVELSERD